MNDVKRWTIRESLMSTPGGDPLVNPEVVLSSDYDALEAECERLRLDAERYRWLRKMHESQYGLTLTIARVGMMELTGWSGDDPDSVIDAALAAKEEI